MNHVLAYLHSRQDASLADLCDYLRFPSISAQPSHSGDIKQCALWLLAYCRRIGMNASLINTAGNPVVFAQTPRTPGTSRPHLLIYGHYDVQPADPLDSWVTPPFAPAIRNGDLFARGASDNKGQLFSHLMAVNAYLATNTELPCDLTFIVEGEEEVGSHSMREFIAKHAARLRCDGVVISDTSMPALGIPAITCSLRGLVSLDVAVQGPRQDLHSGQHGGAVFNPATELCRVLATSVSPSGKVTIPGFYKRVRPLLPRELAYLRRLPFNPLSYRKQIGVTTLTESTREAILRRRTACPTMEIHGLTSGYQGAGTKTIIPSRAEAKVSFRLVPDQIPEDIERLVRIHFTHRLGGRVPIDVTRGFSASPYVVDIRSPIVAAGAAAVKEVWRTSPLLIRDGVSLPVAADFKELLGVDCLLVGFGLPDDNIHAPNEKYSVKCLLHGAEVSAHLWKQLADRLDVH